MGGGGRLDELLIVRQDSRAYVSRESVVINWSARRTNKTTPKQTAGCQAPADKPYISAPPRTRSSVGSLICITDDPINHNPWRNRILVLTQRPDPGCIAGQTGDGTFKEAVTPECRYRPLTDPER